MHLTQKKIVRYFYSLALFIQSFSNLDKHVKGALSLKICTTTSIENLKPMQVVKLFCMLPGAWCLLPGVAVEHYEFKGPKSRLVPNFRDCVEAQKTSSWVG
jgi:hypothetical protein